MASGAPLQNGFRFFLTYPGYCNADKETPYEPFGFFDNTSTFWSNVTHFLQPSFCFTKPACTRRPQVDGSEIEGLALFRGGVDPVWEDPVNTDGGHWQASVTPWERIDDVWDALVMAVVGNVEENNDVVTGIRAVDKTKKGRVEYRVEVWFSTEHPLFSFMNLDVNWKWVSHKAAIDAFVARAKSKPPLPPH